jgi:hypothetical protein
VPMLGVGGHCLPKDGILLWWRALEAREPADHSLILESRRINDESPAVALALAERALGSLAGRRVALLGAAYRGNSEDTRNSPTLATAVLLRERGISFTIHDPYVHDTDANLRRFGLAGAFTRDLGDALRDAEILVLCCPHRVYADGWSELVACAPRARAAVDACNLLTAPMRTGDGLEHAGIGRGRSAPSDALVTAVHGGFEAVERGVANELSRLLEFLNGRYADSDFTRVRFADVQRIAGTCPTGCAIVSPGVVVAPTEVEGFRSRLVARAMTHA